MKRPRIVPAFVRTRCPFSSSSHEEKGKWKETERKMPSSSLLLCAGAFFLFVFLFYPLTLFLSSILICGRRKEA